MANWYSFINCCDGVLNPVNYRKMTGKPFCNPGINICAIYLNEVSFIPSDIEITVQQYIVNALATQISQPTGGAKRFVYLRGPIS
jgi:hypothetical protein